MFASTRRKLLVSGFVTVAGLGTQRSFAQDGWDVFQEEQQGDVDSTPERITIDPLKISEFTKDPTGAMRAKFEPRNPDFSTKLLECATRYIGVDRSNNAAEVSSFLDVFDLPLKDKDGAYTPYCATGVAFAAAVAYREFWKPEATAPSATDLRNSFPEMDAYHFYATPSVVDMYYVARGRRRWRDASSAANRPVPKPGYIVVYSFAREADHCGIVESASATELTTIEFNTSNGLTGSQRNGGMVARRKRPYDSKIKGFIATDTAR